MNAGHLQLAALFVVQINGGFHAAEGRSHVVHNSGDQLIEIEDGRNFLRPLLQFKQMLDLIELHRGNTGWAPEQAVCGLVAIWIQPP